MDACRTPRRYRTPIAARMPRRRHATHTRPHASRRAGIHWHWPPLYPTGFGRDRLATGFGRDSLDCLCITLTIGLTWTFGTEPRNKLPRTSWTLLGQLGPSRTSSSNTQLTAARDTQLGSTVARTGLPRSCPAAPESHQPRVPTVPCTPGPPPPSAFAPAPPPRKGGGFDHAARKGSRASLVGERGSR